MKTILALVGICLVSVAAFLLCGRQKETYRDASVTAGKIWRPINAIAPHLSVPQYLVIGDKTYNGVRGQKPYYLSIPQLNAILFVTEGRNYKVVFHMVNLLTKQDIQIDGDTSGFGWNIGSGRTPGSAFSDYLENVTSNTVTIATCSLKWKATKLLDLSSRSIGREECFYYDSTGAVTRHRVRLKGGDWTQD